MTAQRASQAGFSLLEAIVALTILATAGLALFAAMNQSVQMAQRVETARVADSAVRNAMAWMETVNPSLTPEGEQRFGDVSLRWRSELLEPARDAMTGHLQAGLFEVGLYQVTLELSLDDRPLTTAQMRRVGYRQVREPSVI